MTEEQAKKIVKPLLGAKRWQHTLNVRDMAVKLAKIHGVDREQAALAAILHDAAKELPKADMLQIFEENATISENAVSRPTPVWHGICAAILAETQWGVRDQEVLSAIRCHTTGKPGMSPLDKVIFLADMTSKERDFPGVEELRKLEKKNLDGAMLRALESTLAFVRKEGKPVDEVSAAAYQDLLEKAQTTEDLNHE